MEFDFTPYFKKYETLAQAADQIFDKMCKEYPDCVQCKVECSDCCHALFDITLIEALYIHHKFHETYSGKMKNLILDKANSIDRKIAKIKRQAFKAFKEGKNEGEVLADLSFERARCPFLNADERCDLYEHRPLTCRFYGVPTSIGGSGHTCGKSKFEKGKEYPTVNLDIMHKKLQEISAELVRDLKSRNIKLVDLLVPLSMAILTDYNEEYFGLESDNPKTEKKEATPTKE